MRTNLLIGKYSFRFGDNDDDKGFFGHDGLTGFGWLRQSNGDRNQSGHLLFTGVIHCV